MDSYMLQKKIRARCMAAIPITQEAEAGGA
jgi:hypothetical protein